MKNIAEWLEQNTEWLAWELSKSNDPKAIQDVLTQYHRLLMAELEWAIHKEKDKQAFINLVDKLREGSSK